MPEPEPVEDTSHCGSGARRDGDSERADHNKNNEGALERGISERRLGRRQRTEVSKWVMRDEEAQYSRSRSTS